MIQHSRLAAIVLEPDARIASALLVAFLALLPVEPLYNAPFIALAILGLIRLIFQRVRLDSPEHRFLCIAFLCIWLPMLASLPDAVNPAESLRKTASLCLYFLAGVYVVGAYHRFRDLDRVMIGAAAICTFWALDAVWQFQTGADLFGIPYEEGSRLRGMFFDTGRIGYLLASFAPLVFEAVRRQWRRWWWSPVLLGPYLLTIALSGSRISWCVLAIATAGYLLFLARWSGWPRSSGRRWRPGGTAAVLAGMILTGMLSTYAWPGGTERMWQALEPRVESLDGLWSGDRAQFERAVTWRLSIWITAGNMWSSHWLNGVGPRGFRYARDDEYIPEEDYYSLQFGVTKTPLTPHMLLLEIAAETGTIGLVGYVVLLVALLARLRSLKHDSLRHAYPYALTLIVALLPFHDLGFYGALATGLIWWMMIVCASAIRIRMESEVAPTE